MIDRNFIGKIRNIFLNIVQKFRLKIPYRYQKPSKTKGFHSVMTPMTLFVHSQNLSNFVGSYNL